MTQHATDIFGTVFKNGTATLMARVLDDQAAPIVCGGIRSAVYSVFLLDDEDADARWAVPGHDRVPLTVGDVIFDQLESGPPWDASEDSAGYNFRHVPDASRQPAFPIAGRRYLVEYRLTPAAGQPILVRFRINVI